MNTDSRVNINNFIKSFSQEISNKISCLIPQNQLYERYHLGQEYPIINISNSKIDAFRIIHQYKLSDKFKIEILFDQKMTHLLKDGSYSACFKLLFQTNKETFIVNDTPKQHFGRTTYYKTLDFNQKKINEFIEKLPLILHKQISNAIKYVNKLDSVNQKRNNSILIERVKLVNKTILNSNSILDDFVEVLYLSLPKERKLQIEQVLHDLKHLESISSKDIIAKLKQHKPLICSLELMNHKIDINTIDRAVLEQFIKEFNCNIALYVYDKTILKEINIYEEIGGMKIIDNIDEFFKYWHNYIYEANANLFFKIYKMVGEKCNHTCGFFHSFAEDYDVKEDIERNY